MPPPSRPAELPLIVLSVTVRSPTRQMPPPRPSAELPLIVLSVTVSRRYC